MQLKIVITSYSIHYTKLYETCQPQGPETLAQPRLKHTLFVRGQLDTALLVDQTTEPFEILSSQAQVEGPQSQAVRIRWIIQVHSFPI